MHFCFIGQYSPEAVSALIDHPEVNRHEATKKLIEAALKEAAGPVATPASER